MSNPKDPEPTHPDALSALENFASGKSPTPPAREDSVDASGFVGMLARGSQNEADPAGSSAPPPAMQRPMPQVSPKKVAPPPPRADQLSAAIPVAREIMQPPAEEAMPEATETDAPLSDALAAAHEISNESGEYAIAPDNETLEPAASDFATQPDAPAPQYRSSPGKGQSRRRVPHWFHTAVPISFTVGALLLVIGIWALLAVLGWATGSAMAPGFTPVIHGIDGAPDKPGDSVVMPFVLLLSLPVGLALEVMGLIMLKQLRRQATADAA